MNTINSQKSYDLNGILLSSPPVYGTMDYVFPIEFKKCEKMKITIC